MKYDLHIHTSRYSVCSVLKPEMILKLAVKRGLNGVAVTDHDTFKGSLDVKKLNKNKDFEVITGSEIRSDCGDVLVYYQNEEIKERNLFDIIDRARQQGAIIAVAHPCRVVPWLKFRYPLAKLKGKIDAIETFNSRTLLFENKMVQKTAEKLNFPGVGGSDAHFPFDMAMGYTEFEGDLRRAIKKNKTKVGGTIILGWLSGALSFFQGRVVRKIF